MISGVKRMVALSSLPILSWSCQVLDYHYRPSVENELKEIVAPPIALSTVEMQSENPVDREVPVEPQIDDFWRMNGNIGDLFDPKLLSSQQVREWITYFQGTGKVDLQNALDRGEKYRAMIEEYLFNWEMPPALYYLPVVESGFKFNARSRAHAVGLWQFMSGTAKEFGLIVNRNIDERRDPIRSTKSALEYLSSLQKVFFSWTLALAAYNSGQSRVMNAIISTRERDYWRLIKQGSIPKETREYVPKFLAVWTIGMNPEAYGFRPSPHLSPILVKGVVLPSSTTLHAIAKAANVKKSVLRQLNPHLLSEDIPRSIGKYSIWLPGNAILSRRDLGRYRLADINKKRRANSKARKSFRYRIRRGDNLLKIAKKFGVSLKKIKQINNLKSSQLIAGRYLKIPRRKLASVKYRVRRGDSLYRVAKKFGVTVGQLRRLNRMKGSKLYVGQLLKIKAAL